MSKIIVIRDGTEWGPYSTETINTMLRAGQLMAGDMAWMEGMREWVPLERLSGVIPPPAVAPPALGPVNPTAPKPVQIVRAAPVQATATQASQGTSTMAVVSLITGIFALIMVVLFFPIGIMLGIVAIVCGHVARADVKGSRGVLTGRGLGLGGLLAGYLSLIIPIVTAALALNFIFGGGLKKAVSGLADGVTHATVAAARSTHTTTLLRKEKTAVTAGEPANPAFSLVQYPAFGGSMAAYVSKTAISPAPQRLPAVVWLVGGFGNSIDPEMLVPGPSANDQSASAFHQPGIIVMYPSLRGGNQNPGFKEGLYGEVDDVMAAMAWLKAQPGVDAQRIYLGGHSTGGTLALLTAEVCPDLRAVFSFGPVARVQDYGQENLPYNIADEKENKVRAPVLDLGAISASTLIFEGEEGNQDSLALMQKRNRNRLIQFYSLKNQDHFSGLRPVSLLLAKSILKDNKQTPNLQISELSINEALGL